jgi:hypothetical protein
MNTATNSPGVASIILSQLGGNRFPRGASKRGITGVKIRLEASDTYTVDFFKQNGPRGAQPYAVITVEKLEDVYADSLTDIFTSVTGLAVSL